MWRSRRVEGLVGHVSLSNGGRAPYQEVARGLVFLILDESVHHVPFSSRSKALPIIIKSIREAFALSASASIFFSNEIDLSEMPIAAASSERLWIWDTIGPPSSLNGRPASR